MKFRKIDENTISCILSEEDMQENNIVLEDFFRDKNKVHDFMDVLIQKAKEEVGFESNGELFSLQIMPLPKNGLAITFSDKPDDGAKGLIDQLKQTVGHLEEENGQASPQGIEHILHDMLEEIETLDKKSKSEKTKESVSSKKNEAKKIRVYHFSSMESLEQFCILPKVEENIKSSLYKDETENTYYLILEKGRLGIKRYDACCELALEFADFVSDKEINKLYYMEHYSCILDKKAVAFIRGIAQAK